MKLFKKVWIWVKANMIILLAYLLFITLSIVFANVYINSEIEESYTDIQNEIDYGIFENKKSFGIRDDSYTIVSFSKAIVPPISSESDSSSYNQQYGDLKTYYKASSGWTIRVFKKENETIVESTITPLSAGYKSNTESSPESLFRRLYNNIITDEDYNININNEYKISKLKNLESKYHSINVRSIGIDDAMMWYSFYDGRAFSQIKQDKWYTIVENNSKIDLYRFIFSIISIAIATLIFGIIFKLFKRSKKAKSNKSKFNLDISVKKSSEPQENIEVDIQELLTKINPSNFMSPYDPNKVKIANDLYSALLNSQGNETIIAMIKEKAYSELGIK